MSSASSPSGPTPLCPGMCRRSAPLCAYVRTKSQMGVSIYASPPSVRATCTMMAHSMRFLKSSQPVLYVPRTEPVA